MSFVSRVKKKLLEKNRKEIETVQKSIDEITEMHLIEYEGVQRLKEESEEAQKEKVKVQNTILSSKDMEDLKNIYEFVSNYKTIERVIERIKDIQLPKISNEYIVYMDGDNLVDAETERKHELLRTVKKLNEEITEIFNSDEEPEKSETESEEENDIHQVTEKKGFFARLFGKKIESSKTSEKTTQKEKNLFKQYRRTIREFNDNYNSFLVVDFEEALVIDKLTCARINTSINALSTIKKRGEELLFEDELYLMDMQPHELWKEIMKYYSNIGEITDIVERFDKNLDRYQKLYKEKPHLFDLGNLEKIFEENNQKIIDLKSRSKAVASKKSEATRKKQSERELKEKLKGFEEKKKKLIERKRKIESAKTLKELGFKNKEEAARKLSMETKDYIVIPIPNKVRKISEIFYDEKQLKIEVKGNTFYAAYSNEIATGKINSIESEEDVSAALLISISELKKEDIDSVKSGKIYVYESVLQAKNIIAILPEGKKIDFEKYNVIEQRYSNRSITKQIETLLGEDYLNGSDGVSDYDVFKGIPNVSAREKKSKREAVKKCVFENIKKDITSEDSILVNGKPYYLNPEDEKEIKFSGKLEPLNVPFLEKMADDIETYLIEGEDRGPKIDQFYGELLLEYMRVNRKAKADYYDEDNTEVSINGKRLSIKPILPAKDEEIAKRYSRTREDIVYKTMKLANLVNKFAHMAETQELQSTLYDVKLDLIERTIDLSKNNSQINLKRKFDKQKMGMSVILEIPGYNMVALHALNKSNALTHKSNRLEETQEEVLQSSAILIPGLNREFLSTMKNMTEKERMQALVEMNSTTFSKLVLRMGYTSERISTEESKKKFLKEMVSDRKISELIKENDSIER